MQNILNRSSQGSVQTWERSNYPLRTGIFPINRQIFKVKGNKDTSKASLSLTKVMFSFPSWHLALSETCFVCRQTVHTPSSRCHIWLDVCSCLQWLETGFNFAQCLISPALRLPVCFLFSKKKKKKRDKLQMIKVKSVFFLASNLPNTMRTPPVMRSLLCISQISRGMSLKAYAFNWLRRSRRPRRSVTKEAVFLEGCEFN